MKRRTAWILVAGVAALALGAAAVGALALVLRGGAKGATFGSKDAYLALDLSGDVPEQPASELGFLFDASPPSLRALVESLDRGAADPKIKGAIIEVGGLSDSGWGKVQELRDAIARFRKSGKPAYAYIEFCGNREYYLATACSKIYAIPSSLVLVSGLAAEVTFFRRTLDKLGVQAEFEGVGKYKNAPNQFTEDRFTPPHREQTEALVDSLFGQYVDAIAESRSKTDAEVRALIDHGPYDGESALAAGLVDELVYRDELEKRLKNAERLTPGRYVRASRGFSFDGRAKVALIYAVGEIVSGRGGSGPFSGGVVGAETLARVIREARNNDQIRAIVLRVDSPGGSGTASDVIWREVGLARKVKPVVISMGDVAASGGYYIAMNSDAIVAEPGTITGSIGVFSGKFNLRGLYDKIGLTKEIVTRGRNATIFSDYQPWSTEEKARMRALMTSFYADFIQKAATGRQKTVEEIDRVAQGRVWTGAEALEVGLVDRLGGLDVALSIAREKAKIGKDEELDLVVLPERKGFYELLMEHQEEGVSERLLPSEIRAMAGWAAHFSGQGLIARMPFELQVR
ncbi:MAG: signal peptide peptidase SppA [Solirubrobacterales bacterium]